MLVFLIIPQTAGAMPIFNRRGSVVVLIYNKLSENPLEWGDYCIPPHMFESDIEYLKSEGYLTEQQIFQMSKEQCVEIGSHSDKLHFKSYGELSAMYDDIRCEDEIISDYKNNDNLIYKITGKKSSALSYPNGINSKRIDGKLKEGGKKVTFSTAETTFSGIEKNIPVGRRNRSCQRDIKNILR